MIKICRFNGVAGSAKPATHLQCKPPNEYVIEFLQIIHLYYTAKCDTTMRKSFLKIECIKTVSAFLRLFCCNFIIFVFKAISDESIAASWQR